MKARYNKALIVEDEITTRSVLVNALESMGVCCIQASQGQRGLEVFLDNPDIALIVTDVMMPEMDGMEFIHKLRNAPVSSKVKILAVSGRIGPKQILEVLEKGADRFLPKPVSIPEFRDYVQHLLEVKKE